MVKIRILIHVKLNSLPQENSKRPLMKFFLRWRCHSVCTNERLHRPSIFVPQNLKEGAVYRLVHPMLSKEVNWHDDHPYERFVQQVVPQSRWSSKIERALLQIWEASHYDYKLYKSKDESTFYDLDLELIQGQESALDTEIKKEEKAFEDLAKKLETLQKTVTEPSDHESEEHSSEEEMKPKKQASKKSPQHSLKAYKSSLATSQAKLKGLQEKLEALQQKREAYTRYQAADQYYSKAMRGIVQHYIATQNETSLIQDLDAMFDAYDKKMREGSLQSPCSGTDFCETHYLPLVSVSTGRPFSFHLQCRLSPTIA
jgi:hypothetical protein